MAVTISIILVIRALNTWISVLLVLVFIRGIIVMFIYVASSRSNEKFKTKISMKTSMFFILIITTISPIFSNYYINKVIRSYKINIFIVIILTLLVSLSAIIPPKLILSFYRGMKTSK